MLFSVSFQPDESQIGMIMEKHKEIMVNLDPCRV